MPPYYSLGFQLSRYGYTSTDHMELVLNRTKQYNIPVVSILSMSTQLEG